jgi:hypothetical protein
MRAHGFLEIFGLGGLCYFTCLKMCAVDLRNIQDVIIPCLPYSLL